MARPINPGGGGELASVLALMMEMDDRRTEREQDRADRLDAKAMQERQFGLDERRFKLEEQAAKEQLLDAEGERIKAAFGQDSDQYKAWLKKRYPGLSTDDVDDVASGKIPVSTIDKDGKVGEKNVPVPETVNIDGENVTLQEGGQPFETLGSAFERKGLGAIMDGPVSRRLGVGLATLFGGKKYGEAVARSAQTPLEKAAEVAQQQQFLPDTTGRAGAQDLVGQLQTSPSMQNVAGQNIPMAVGGFRGPTEEAPFGTVEIGGGIRQPIGSQEEMFRIIQNQGRL
jgi:hypothetical protein